MRKLRVRLLARAPRSSLSSAGAATESSCDVALPNAMPRPRKPAPPVSSGGASSARRATPSWRGEVTLRRAQVPNDGALRLVLARSFADDACRAHESIARFARFSLELLAFGAPPDLVQDACVAARDRVEHARIAFALASRFARGALGPAPLDVRDAHPASTLERAVVRAVHEGCVGETVASRLTEERAAAAVDRQCRDVLRRIARDESRHAELAWRFVAWALGEHPALTPRVADAFRTAIAARAEVRSTCSDPRARSYGRITAAEEARLVAEAVETIVRPCAAVLVDSARAAMA